MKLTVLQENLKKAVNLTSHFISNKAQLPILSNILIKTDKSKLILSATNLENSITTSISCKIDEEGEICVNGKILNEMISNLSSGNIDIDASKEQLKITSAKFKSNLLGTNTLDFPKLSNSLGKNTLLINKEDFVKNLSKVLFSTSLDETRPILTGVMFAFDSNHLSFVSTDGFRLSEVKLKSKIDSENFSLIIPKAILNEIVKIEDEGDIEMFYDKSNNQIVFKIGDIILSSRIIEGSFPDYKKIIPKSSEIIINVDKIELEKALKLSSIFSRDASNIVKIKIKDQLLIVEAESSTSGKQETEIEIRSEDKIKKDLEIMFNFRFLEEVLKSIESDEVQIKILDANTAAIFLDPENSNFLHLIMPIKSQK